MRTRTRLRSVSPPRRLWSSTIWPPLAGAVTAVGVFAACSALGVLTVVVMYAVTSAFAIAVSWGLALEIGLDSKSVVQRGLYSALAVVVTLGLAEVHPLYGVLAGFAVGLSSPVSLNLLAKARPRSKKPGANPDLQDMPGVLMDKAMLDRRFDEIVNELRKSGDFPER